jgi:predicted hydrocarbon binding protein
MQSTFSMLVSRRPGLLAQIVSALVREGCKLERQAVAHAADPSLQRFTVTVDGPEATVRNLPRLLLRFGDVETQADSAAVAAPQPVDVEATVQEIIGAFPDVAERVCAFGRSLPAVSRTETLSLLGERLGRREFQRSYALGSPLKLEQALRRMVLPAVRQIARVDLEGSALRLPSCPFCAAPHAEVPCCDFLVGFVRGLLHSAPATAGTSVREARCRVAGAPFCELVILAV